MKSKIFKTVLIVSTLLIAFMECRAQQDTTLRGLEPIAPLPAVKMKVAPKMNVLAMTAPMKFKMPMVMKMPMELNMSSPIAFDFQYDQTDSIYKRKMIELNIKMEALRKQMNELRNEEMKQKNTEMAKARADMNEKSFNRAFASPKAFNYDKDKQMLQEKIKSGEVKEVIKSYSKSYSVGKNDLLTIDNSFGRVTINTWTKNEFKVDVEIKADADSQDEAQKLVDGVSINDSKDGSTVAFKTNFAEKNHNSWNYHSNDGKYSIHQVQINYIVYMPSKNSLTITNRYGATIVPDFEGKLTIDNSYGSFTAKKLTNPANDISTRYGSATIENLTGSDIKVAYGSLDLGTCDNLNAEISYSPAKIATLKTSGTINLKYGGGLKIAGLDKNFKNLAVTSNYSNVTLGLSNDQNINFDVTVRYGGFNYGNGAVTVTDKTPDDQRGYSSSKTYKGIVGKGNADKTISIKTNYSNVNFNL